MNVGDIITEDEYGAAFDFVTNSELKLSIYEISPTTEGVRQFRIEEVPEYSKIAMMAEIKSIRDTYLSKYDYTQLSDAPFSEEQKVVYAKYREYLRKYTLSDNWWKTAPLTFEDWNNGRNN